MSHRAEISFFMASSRLIARHARETSGRLAPAAHFAKFESRRNGNFPAHTLRVMAVMQSRADRETKNPHWILALGVKQARKRNCEVVQRPEGAAVRGEKFVTAGVRKPSQFPTFCVTQIHL